MAKITKTNMAVTVDSWIHNWLSEQNEKRSTLVNKILKKFIIAKAEEPKRQKRLLEMTHSEREAVFEAHMKRIYEELDMEGEE